MADTYIDQFETITYGKFAMSQIKSRAMGLEPAYDGALKHVSGKLKKATTTVAAALEKAGGMSVVTYKPKAGSVDPVAGARAESLSPPRCPGAAPERTRAASLGAESRLRCLGRGHLEARVGAWRASSPGIGLRGGTSRDCSLPPGWP
jgi:hypothetical protein